MVPQVEGNLPAGGNLLAPQPSLVLGFSSAKEVFSRNNGFPEGWQDSVLLESTIQKIGEEFSHPRFNIFSVGAQSKDP